LRHALDVAPNSTLDKRVAAFIDANPNLPPAQRLRDPWLETLGKRGRWKRVLAYTHADDDTADQCRAVHARIALNEKPVNNALALWRVGHSQPATCNPVFAWLDKQGLLTADEILRRARLSLLAGQYGMVRYLAGKLPDKLAAKTQKWLAVTQNATALRTVRIL